MPNPAQLSSRFVAAKTPTKKLPGARGRLLEIHKKNSPYSTSAEIHQEHFCLLCSTGQSL
jgi:hypothetical protein